MDNLTELYCLIDDFCKDFEPQLNARLLANGERKRIRVCRMSLAEMMTLVVLFHQLGCRQFKYFYLYYVCQHYHDAFPRLLSYNRLVELMPRCTLALSVLFHTLKGKSLGIAIADSTPIAVCDNLRIKRHRIFKGLAERGKSSTGWFFGFKLHVIINHQGELINIYLTPGNVDDRKPIPKMAQKLTGRLYADKGYLSKALANTLKDNDLTLITKVRRNMKPVELSDFDQALLRRRSLIETVFDELKNLCQIEHTRHRSPKNFVVNLFSGLIAYCLKPCKPRLPLSFNGLSLIPN